jgi:phage-related tail protein
MIEKLFNKKKYLILKKNNHFISYEKDDLISKKLSSFVDGRLIWGGDETIEKFKKFNTKLKCSDLFFVDKYSISIFNSNFLSSISKNEVKNIVKKFYNDTFILDQNACSSPHIIFWEGSNIKKAQDIFWKSLESYVKDNYKYAPEVFSQKYKLYNQYLFDVKHCKSKIKSDQIIFRIELQKIEKKFNIDSFRGFSGLFFEYKINKLDDLNKVLNDKIQTITYLGYEKNFLNKFIQNNNITGIDRIVPVGKALDLDFKWDGYNIIERLTRTINIY